MRECIIYSKLHIICASYSFIQIEEASKGNWWRNNNCPPKNESSPLPRTVLATRLDFLWYSILLLRILWFMFTFYCEIIRILPWFGCSLQAKLMFANVFEFISLSYKWFFVKTTGIYNSWEIKRDGGWREKGREEGPRGSKPSSFYWRWFLLSLQEMFARDFFLIKVQF